VPGRTHLVFWRVGIEHCQPGVHNAEDASQSFTTKSATQIMRWSLGLAH
jgi:hypothetical protein